jgi:hypothetical protein
MVDKEVKKGRQIYGQMPPESEGWGVVLLQHILESSTTVEIEDGITTGKVVLLRIIKNDKGEIIAIPGGEGAPISSRDLTRILSEKKLQEVRNAKRRGREKIKNRLKKKKR